MTRPDMYALPTITHYLVLLWYYGMFEPYPVEIHPAAEEATRQLVGWDYLTMSDDATCVRYVTTERGDVFVRALTTVPQPVRQWVVPEVKR